MFETPVGPSTARTLNPTGWTMRQQLCGILRCKATEQAKLFEMYLTADDWDRQGVDQQKRDAIPASTLQCSLTVRA
jgi:hypothetical protein